MCDVSVLGTAVQSPVLGITALYDNQLWSWWTLFNEAIPFAGVRESEMIRID